MAGPRFLVDWPWVVVDIECSLCPRQGRYRLARLAERYGAAMALDLLLEAVAADCTLMRQGEKPRQYEARCGIRYVVPPAGPAPAEAPARAGAPKLRAATAAGKKRLGYDGPAPTLAMLRRQGITTLSVTCHGLWQGQTCHHTTTLLVERLTALDDMPFPELRRSLRMVCGRCGSRTMHIVPLWPDPRKAHEAALGVKAEPTMPGTVVPYRMPGTSEQPRGGKKGSPSD